MSDISSMANVIGVGPDLIEIEVTSTADYEKLEDKLEIGSYLKISDENGASVVALVQSFKIKDTATNEHGTDVSVPKFVLATQPVGRLEDGKFRRGGKQITIPPKKVEIASSNLLSEIYDATPVDKRFSFGHLVQNEDVAVSLDGDKFFGKHIGVVGSTGSGKSSTVAAIIQEGVRASSGANKAGCLNNSHVIIFDLHGEYSAAFPEATVVGVDEVKLPYWLMNSEELEEMFIESNEQNSHNQVSQFRRAVTENKVRHNKDAAMKISYDSPVYFSLEETFNYLSNLNNEVVSKIAGENCPKFSDNGLVHDRADHYFDSIREFVESSQSKGDKASGGPFHGEFNRFLMRLEGRRNDNRLDFLLDPRKNDGSTYQTDDLEDILRQFMGYANPRSNVTIIDLSGIPFEVDRKSVV